MSRDYLHPEKLHNMPQFYTQVVSVAEPGSRTVYISGQTSQGADGKLVGKGDLAAQAEQVMKNLQAAVESAGGHIGDIVKTNFFICDITPEKTQIVGGASVKCFSGGSTPASTWVGVTGLVNPGYMLEVEAIAVIAE